VYCILKINCNRTRRNKEIEVAHVVLNVKWTCAVNEMTDYIICVSVFTVGNYSVLRKKIETKRVSIKRLLYKYIVYRAHFCFLNTCNVHV